ncbi:MAG: hypothetical protein WBZ48_05960 [Bacteroidota bacterium]
MNALSTYTPERLRRLPLHEYYERSNIRLGEEGGWLLPKQFHNLADEVSLLEHGPALLDFSDHGLLSLEGKDAVDFLNRISTNDFRNFSPGGSQQTVLTSEKGRAIDSIIVADRHDHLLLIVSRGAQYEVKQWIEKFIIMEDVNVVDRTGQHLLFVLFNALDATKILSGDNNYQAFRAHYYENDVTFFIADAEAGILGELHPVLNCQVGNDAYNFFRIQHGIPCYKKEMDGEFNPLELNLWNQVSFSKGCYIGQEVIARLDTYKRIQRVLCRIRIDGPLLPEAKYPLTSGEKEIGKITSFMPDAYQIDSCVGLAIVRKEYAIVGSKHPAGNNAVTITIQHVFERIEDRNGNHNGSR